MGFVSRERETPSASPVEANTKSSCRVAVAGGFGNPECRPRAPIVGGFMVLLYVFSGNGTKWPEV